MVDKMEGESQSGKDGKEAKPLSLGQAAFLLLRVRKVFKKKLALKKEKNFAQDVVFPKSELNSSIKRKSKVPLIRSRTVPAIIVPFSILQAHINKNANLPNTSPAPNLNLPQSKSDFSQPHDYVQFLTGSPPAGKRDSYFGGPGNSPGDHPSSVWNANNMPMSPVLEKGKDLGSPQTSAPGSGSRGFGGRLSRFLITPSSGDRKTSVFSANQQHMFNWSTEPGSESQFCTPRPLRRRRSLEYEDINLCRPRAESIDSLIRRNTNSLHPGKDNFSKRYSTASCGPQLTSKADMRLNDGFITAVESGNILKVKTILETTDIDINSLTTDGLSLLDVAAIQRNTKMVKVLLSYGATENRYCKESISDQLNSMVHEAEKKSEDLMAKILKGSTFGSLSPAQLKDLEKEFHFWEKRYKRFRKMRTEYTQIRPPDRPQSATLEVLGSTSVRIRFQESESPSNSICTKYKIEWSTDENFSPNDPSTRQMEIVDLRKLETNLTEFTSGLRLFFRISLGNCKGYGEYQNTTPFSVLPSSWRDIFDGRKPRYAGKSIIFDDIFSQIKNTRPEYASEIKHIDLPGKCADVSPIGTGPSNLQKKNQKIISIKQLFAGAPKFQKNFKRGVFLTCVIYSEDKLLMTTEEFLPTIEIDENFPSSLHNDFHWLLKVAWEDIKSFKQDMERSGSASTFHFRLKLLQACAAMQSALGIVDLGRLYYKTIRDKNNSVVVISTINYVRSAKQISSLNIRWVPLSKITQRKSEDITDILINSIQDQILYHQVSNIPLGKGLFIGYLKLASSVELLKILVSEKTPNFLPHMKIRDNSHVSSEEWIMIQKMVRTENGEKSNSQDSLNFEANNNATNLPEDDQQIQITPPPTSSNNNSSNNSNEEISNSGLSNNNFSSFNFSSNNNLNAPSPYPTEFTEAQELFRSQVNIALKKLFSYLEIDYESSLNHRLYNYEVVEISPVVSLIIVYPALENVCLVAGQSDKLLQRNDLLSIPIQLFEMIHLSTYQKEIVSRYARLASIIEMDTILAQHCQREAFSTTELSLAKQRLKQLQEIQLKIDTNWRTSRWIMDVMTWARDKNSPSASIRTLMEYELKISSESILSADASMRRSEELQLSRFLSSNKNNLLGFGLSGSGNSLGGGSDQSGQSGDNLLSLNRFGNGMKFSKSENQLAIHLNNKGNSNLLGGGSKPYDQLGERKVSVATIPSGEAGEEMKDQLSFVPKIYSSHSQSDSTIAANTLHLGGVDGNNSASLHNLYHDVSSNNLSTSHLGQQNLNSQKVINNQGGGQPPLVVVSEIMHNSAEQLNVSTKNPVCPTFSAPAPMMMSTNSSPLVRKHAKYGHFEAPKVNSTPICPPVPPRQRIPQSPLLGSLENDSNKTNTSSSSIGTTWSDSTVQQQQPNLLGSTSTMNTSINSNSILNFQINPGGGNPDTGNSNSMTSLAYSPLPFSKSIIQVYAAYDCGLSEGTSVRLQVTSQTTARQITDLVVKQLNTEVRAKGQSSPIYERSQDFCLVAVIGERERCIRNDFKPLTLTSPWKEGRLFIRKKVDITAAIDMNKSPALNQTL